MNFPKQNIEEHKKNREWCLEMVNAIVKSSANSNRNSRERRKDYDNYMLFNGVFDQKQFEYITNTYGLTTPARLVNYPIIQPKIDLLVGEYVNYPLKYSVHTVNKDAVSRKLDEKSKMIAALVTRPILRQLEELTRSDMGANAMSEFSELQDLEDFMSKNYREDVEVMVFNSLEYLSYKYSLKDIYKRGLYDLCITGKEFYKVDIINNDPRVRRVDPRSLVYDQNIETEYLDDCMYVGEERYLTINEIIDEFRSFLKHEDIVKLEEIRQSTPSQVKERMGGGSKWYFNEQGNFGSQVRIKIVHAEWKSIRQIKVKVSENKYDPDTPFIKILPPGYKPRKTDKIETRYITDVWEATKIADDILVRYRRRPNQVRFERDISNTNLSYIGCIRNNIDGNTVSIVDSLKNIQLLYNVIMYHIELAMSRAGGKSVVYDTAQTPAGMDMATVMYHVKNSGIIPINSKLEGNQMATFNQFQQVDFTLSNSVQQLINLKMMLEDTANKVTGISNERAGVTKGYEAVGTTERSVYQSSLITQPLFYIHGKVIEKVMNQVANLLKVSWAKKDSMSYVLGDATMKLFETDETMANSDYGIFVTSAVDEGRKKESVLQLGQAALQSGNISFLDMVKVLNADSTTQAEAVLERGLKAIQEQQMAMQEQQMEAQQQMAQAEGQKGEREMAIAQLGAETKIESARIQAGSAESSTIRKTESAEDISYVQQQAMLKRAAMEQEEKSQE